MRKNILTRALAISLCAFAAVPAVACGGGSQGEAIDHTRTQIRMYHYNAGYGDKWPYELKENFEALMADVSFEEGKKGVQVLISGDMVERTADRWRAEPYDVLFLENPYEFYGMMKTGVVEPLDEIMETPSATDANLQNVLMSIHTSDGNQKIAEKMTQQQRDAYTYDGHYYAIPHYAGHYGIIYNIDLFDQYGLYLAAEPDEDTGDILISTTNPTKSVGPDGKTGVIDGVDYSADDGLPRTYDEFFDLCFEIDQKGIDPVCWPGYYANHHLTEFLENLMANHEGAEQMNLNFTFDGTASNLIKFDNSGNIMYNDDGTPMVESLEITEDKGYELARQEGKYYAMKFIERLLTNKDYYNEADGLGGTSHVEMQQKFLENGKLGIRQNAMLVDGVWWQMEADAVFERMTREDEKWAKENRRFGWMPLPQATEEEAEAIANGTKNTVYMDYLNAVACVKSGLTEPARNASMAFLKYAYSDEALANFTYTTGTTIGVEYLDVIDYDKLTHYEQTLMNYIKKSDFVSRFSDSEKLASNMKNFAGLTMYASTEPQIFIAMTQNSMSAENYFKGHQNAYKGLAWA